VPLSHHLGRIAPIMAGVALLLGWLASQTQVMFADGLRYIAAAQSIEHGSWADAVRNAVDHPAYPFAIATAQRILGDATPSGWQVAAQAASVLAGILLVIPVYLFAFELYGQRAAWLATVLTFLVPLTGHVMADALSESTFLLFWTTGCWAALRFLRDGAFGWLIATLAFACLAYLARPEGLLLPAALAATVCLLPALPFPRLARRRWLVAMSLLVVGPIALAGPFIVFKGGLGTKPAVGRLLGLSGRSPAQAVERERPLEPDQTVARTLVLAVRATWRAVLGAVTIPLVPLSVVGFLAAWRDRERRRPLLFATILGTAWLLALVRLHATSGYCTPRHALILAIPMIAAAANGLLLLVDRLSRKLSARAPSPRESLFRGALLGGLVTLFAIAVGHDLVAPINEGFQSYRQAGEWLAVNTPQDARVVDLKGWATYYGNRDGYSFNELGRIDQDRTIGWVVAHDAFLIGPWDYCDTIRRIVGDRRPVRSFPEKPKRGISQVHVFKLSDELAEGSKSLEPEARK
jgi:4-amino-4-deoxy-L-arabinose transferase-like glycosyltransferase